MSDSPGAKAVWAKTGESKDNALWRLPEWFSDTPSHVVDVLKIYHSELLKFNLRLNLISRGTERDADEVHFADCLQACMLVQKAGVKSIVHDIGSGNGLPGIILGILSPDVEIHLVESDLRKCEFLKHAINVLKLKNVKVMNVRLESVKNHNVKFGITRGFASLSKTLLACNKIFERGGVLYHLKGTAWSSEVAEIPSQIISAWKPELVAEYTLPSSQARRGVIRTSKIGNR